MAKASAVGGGRRATKSVGDVVELLELLGSTRERLIRFVPVIRQRPLSTPGLSCGRCPPGSAGVPPAPLPGTASALSAACIDRQRRRGFPWAVLLRFTPKGPLPACNLPLTLRDLQPGIRLRAGRPRSRGGALRAARAHPNYARGSVDLLPVPASHVRPTSFKKLKITPPLRGSRRSRAGWRRLLRWGGGRRPTKSVGDVVKSVGDVVELLELLGSTRERLIRFVPVIRQRPLSTPGLSCGRCPPGSAGVPPAPLPATASALSAACIDRQRRRGAPRAVLSRFTPKGPLPACNLPLTLRDLQPGIRLRAGRPRSRGGRPSGGPCTSEFCERLR